MNLPNTITIGRLVLTGVFIIAASMQSHLGSWIAFVTFALATFSDFLDGYLARKLNLVTSLGKLLDPLADKILVAAAFVHLTTLGLCPAWVTSIILAREFLVTGIRQIAVEQNEVIAADKLGKWKTTLQLTYCLAALIWLLVKDSSENLFYALTSPSSFILPASLYGSLALTVVSGVNYTWKSRHLLKN